MTDGYTNRCASCGKKTLKDLKKYDTNDIIIKTSKRHRTIDTAKYIIKGMYPNASNPYIESPTKDNPLLPDAYSHNDLLEPFYQNTPQKIIQEIYYSFFKTASIVIFIRRQPPK